MDVNESSLKSRYQFHEKHRPGSIIISIDDTHQHYDTNNDDASTISEKQILEQHLKVIITIGCISVGIFGID